MYYKSDLKKIHRILKALYISSKSLEKAAIDSVVAAKEAAWTIDEFNHAMKEASKSIPAK